MFVVQCIIFCVCKLLVGFSFLCLPYYTQVKIQLLRKQKGVQLLKIDEIYVNKLLVNIHSLFLTCLNDY